MKIVVCVKQVPDTTEIKIDPVKNTLIRTGVPSILNPFDRNAVETALQLKDTYGGEVTVLSMGPPQAKAALTGRILSRTGPLGAPIPMPPAIYCPAPSGIWDPLMWYWEESRPLTGIRARQLPALRSIWG